MLAVYFLLTAAAAFAAGWWLRARRSADPIRKHPRGMEEKDPYRLCECVLTTPEAAFYESLHGLLPRGYHVLVKVRLSDVLNVRYGAGDRGEAHARINAKCLDFVVCDAAHLPVFAVLLGETDDRRSREFIERVCTKVGLPIHFLPAQPAYPAAQLRPLADRFAQKLAA